MQIFESSELCEALRYVAKSMEEDEDVYHRFGALIDNVDGQTKIFTADGPRLHAYSLPFYLGERYHFVPDEIYRLIALSSYYGTMMVAEEDGQLFFSCVGHKLLCGCNDDTWFNVIDWIGENGKADDYDVELIFLRKKFIDLDNFLCAVGGLLSFGDRVVCKIIGGKGNNYINFMVTYEGGVTSYNVVTYNNIAADFEIGFNPIYFFDALGPGENVVKLSSKDPLNMLIFSGEKHKAYVMPCKLEWKFSD